MTPFSYYLPESKIAQRPVHPYDAAKLLVVDRESGSLQSSVFSNIGEFLKKGDLLVLNDTRVIPARFFGKFAQSGGDVEVVILEESAPHSWISLGRPLKRFREGAVLEFSHGLRARIEQKISTDRVRLDFHTVDGSGVKDAMEKAGVMPIPPYIRNGVSDDEDKKDYQTFFGWKEGSVAAPTASLHFTPELLQILKTKGVLIEYLTLHVGAASFLPLWHEHENELRKPGSERFNIQPSLLIRMTEVRKNGGRVIAVGTTVVRALESAKEGSDTTGLNTTDLFITPGHQFKNIDALITNFHQPRTTHLLLVEAFMGQSLLAKTYEYALNSDFRFLSYGDGMLIL